MNTRHHARRQAAPRCRTASRWAATAASAPMSTPPTSRSPTCPAARPSRHRQAAGASSRPRRRRGGAVLQGGRAGGCRLRLVPPALAALGVERLVVTPRVPRHRQPHARDGDTGRLGRAHDPRAPRPARRGRGRPDRAPRAVRPAADLRAERRWRPVRAAGPRGPRVAEHWGADVLHAHDWHGALAPHRWPGQTTVRRSTTSPTRATSRRPSRCARLPEPLVAGDYGPRPSTAQGGHGRRDAVTTVSPSYAHEISRPSSARPRRPSRCTRLSAASSTASTQRFDPARDRRADRALHARRPRRAVAPPRAGAAAALPAGEAPDRRGRAADRAEGPRPGADSVPDSLERRRAAGRARLRRSRPRERLPLARRREPARVAVRSASTSGSRSRSTPAPTCSDAEPVRAVRPRPADRDALRLRPGRAAHRRARRHDPRGRRIPRSTRPPPTRSPARCGARSRRSHAPEVGCRRRRAMAVDHSWARSAQAYLELYEELVAGAVPSV